MYTVLLGRFIQRLLFFIGIAGFDPRKGRPRITAWMERVAKETSPYYQEAHKFIEQMATTSKL
jgi:glutathione S-transferase